MTGYLDAILRSCPPYFGPVEVPVPRLEKPANSHSRAKLATGSSQAAAGAPNEGTRRAIKNLLHSEIRLLFAQPGARHYSAPVALKGMEM